MVDVAATIEAKSDQLNADDLIGRDSITITITKVKGGDREQPIVIHYDGDNGKPYKPGKSMRRVMVALWGGNGDDYVGRSLTLYRDPEVEFGKLKVGGLRISHMSHLEDGNGKSIPLTVRRGQKALFDVRPLRMPAGNGGDQGGERKPPAMTPEQKVDAYVAAVGKIETLEALQEYQADERRAKFLTALANSRPDLHEKIVAANSAAFARLSPATADDTIQTDDDGDGFDDDDVMFPADLEGGDE